jgi:hypothetical protein
MTANELADKLKLFWHTENDSLFEQAATMLRQQAKKIEDLLEHNVKLIDDLFSERKEVIRLEAEIAMLKQIIDANNLQSDIGQFKKAGEK